MHALRLLAIALPLLGSIACTRPSGSNDPSPEADRGAVLASQPEREPAPKAEPNDPECVRACARFTECAGAEHGEDCLTDCQQELRVRNPKAPAALADCLAKLTCEAIVESLSQDSGATGLCYSASLDAR